MDSAHGTVRLTGLLAQAARMTWQLTGLTRVRVGLTWRLTWRPTWQLTWHWDGMDDIDPAKAASARKTDLESGSTTWTRLFAAAGYDAETEWAKEADLLGVSLDEYKAMVRDKRWKAGNAQQKAPAQAPA